MMNKKTHELVEPNILKKVMIEFFETLYYSEIPLVEIREKSIGWLEQLGGKKETPHETSEMKGSEKANLRKKVIDGKNVSLKSSDIDYEQCDKCDWNLPISCSQQERRPKKGDICPTFKPKDTLLKSCWTCTMHGLICVKAFDDDNVACDRHNERPRCKICGEMLLIDQKVHYSKYTYCSKCKTYINIEKSIDSTSLESEEIDNRHISEIPKTPNTCNDEVDCKDCYHKEHCGDLPTNSKGDEKTD